MMMERPKINLKINKTDYAFEALAGTFLILNVLKVALNFSDLPAQIPQHFSGTGAVDGVGSKNMILFLPGISLFTFLLLSVAQRIPHHHNFPVQLTPANITRQYENSVRMLRVIKAITCALFLYIAYGTIETAYGHMNGLSNWFVPITITALATTIIYFVTRSYRL